MPSRMHYKSRLAAACISIAALASVAVAFGAIQGQTNTEHEVAISDFAYNPSPIFVKLGDTITWTNNDIVPHTATMTISGVSTGQILLSESDSMKMEEAGTVDYHCEYHAGMRGKIVVE